MFLSTDGWADYRVFFLTGKFAGRIACSSLDIRCSRPGSGVKFCSYRAKLRRESDGSAQFFWSPARSSR